MGRKRVIEIILDAVEDPTRMMELKDGSAQKKTGFTKACEFGKYEIVELLLSRHQSSIETEDLYMGFKSACSRQGSSNRKKIIKLLLSIDAVRSHIMENKDSNITTDSGRTSIRESFTWRNEVREFVITFEEGKYDTSDIEVNNTPN